MTIFAAKLKHVCLMDSNKRIRYISSLLMILLMIGAAECLGEKEIIFPEMAALTIGLWIIDKQVWKVRRRQIILLMTLGAFAGVCIVRYSPLPFLINLCLAFAFTAVCLSVSRTTLIPQISACMLPVLLHTETWVYPVSVCLLSVVAVTGQRIMERKGIRHPAIHTAANRNWKRDARRWFLLLCFVFLIGALAVYTRNNYLIIPPLIVTFAEFVHSKAGFRTRPVQVFLFLVTASVLGTVAEIAGHYYLRLPQSIVALFIGACLFGLFEWTGKFFAPAGALALIPLIVPREGLAWLPLQAAAGAALFITIAMVVFQQCYKWSRAQLLFCLTPTLLRKYLSRRKRAGN